MNKPSDIPQWAWDASRHALSDGFEIRIESFGHAERVARAILKARQDALEEAAKVASGGYSEMATSPFGQGRYAASAAIRSLSQPQKAEQ